MTLWVGGTHAGRLGDHHTPGSMECLHRCLIPRKLIWTVLLWLWALDGFDKVNKPGSRARRH